MDRLAIPAEWRPERKIVGAAIAALGVWAVQLAFPELEVPPGIEGAVTVIAGYLIPNR